MSETYSTATEYRMGSGTILYDIPLSKGYRLKEPVMLEWEQLPQGYIIICPMFDSEYGYGDIWDSALNDLGTSIIDFFHSLKHHRAELAPHLLDVLALMEKNLIN
jgi:hypothetical protein